MPLCSIPGCRNRTARTKAESRRNVKDSTKITFHQFPKEPEKRMAWLHALNLSHWTPSKRSVVCSKHFLEKSFDRTSLSCVRLREDALPYPPEDNEIKLEDFSPEEDNLEMGEEHIMITLENPLSEVSTDTQEISVLQEREYVDRSTSVCLETYYSASEVQEMQEAWEKRIKYYQERLRLANQKCKRAKNTIATLKHVLTSLRAKNLITDVQYDILRNIDSEFES